ncbi:MAG: thioredoxin family protein [Pontixanthobacter sp.]
MLRLMALSLAAVSLNACAAGSANHGMAAHPEARPYAVEADAQTNLNAAIARAAANDKLVLIAMGGNWCHDSRAFAGWLETPRFSALVTRHYEVVFIDAGMPRADKGRNLDIPARYGIEVEGTPSVIIATPDGRVLNADSAAKWYDAASRSEDAIYRELQSYVMLPDG